MRYEAGDIFVTSGNNWFSRAIQKLTGSKASHVGIVFKGGDRSTAEVVEALGKGVVRRPFSEGPGKGKHAVYRPLNLSPGAIAAGMVTASSKIGKPYGWGKIAAQALDALIPIRINGRAPFVFRRLAGLKNMPICSYLVDQVVGDMLVYDLRQRAGDLAYSMEWTIEPFGVPRNTLTPGDVLNFCEDHPDKYRCIDKSL